MTVALVGNTNTPTSAAVTSLATTYSSVAGSCLVLSIATRNSILTGVTDSAGNTWTAGPKVSSSTTTRIEIWYVVNAAAITSVTSAFPSSQCVNMLAEFSGVASATPLDQSTSNANASGTTCNTGSITTTNPDDVLVAAACAIAARTLTLDAGPGFTQLDNVADTGSAGERGANAYKIVGSTGTYNNTWTLDTAAVSAGAILALKAAAPSPPRPLVVTRASVCRAAVI